MNKEIPWQSQGLMERHTLLLEQRVSVGTTSLQWSSDYCFPPFLSFSGRAFLWSCSSFVVVQLLSCVWLFVTLWTAACLAFIVLHHLPEFAHTHVHWVGDAIQPSHPLLSPSPPVFNISQHGGLFQWVGASHQVAKVLEFQFSISSSNEYSGLISFRIDWLDLLAVQGILKILLQHHSSKACILRGSAFYILRLSHPYMITRNTIASTIWTFIGTVMSLLFKRALTVFFFLPQCVIVGS